MMTIVNECIPYNYERTITDLYRLISKYPYGRIESIGRSVLGKQIPHLLIGHGSHVVHINASFHANEWITTNALMKFLETYLRAIYRGERIAGIDAQLLYENITLSIVPIVNPDGVNLVIDGINAHEAYSAFIPYIGREVNDFQGWKANIRGVDLNNQFPAYWEIERERKIPKSPHFRDFPGYAPLSEPEAKAMVQVAKRYQFDCVIALHTQGEEFYWGYMNKEPMEAKEMAEYFEKVSGYRAVRTIDSHAGYKDWFILETGKLGFTLELGKGINPIPLSQFHILYPKTESILANAMNMLACK
ncbi:M14 family metallopeptidase [Priestia flexa]|uniref:M14 family metallopeptidase n=1 Tax=Priestia flexa TaxID=86664 RepID=UPI001F43B957|nr:M14 family metallocarboxypeptidase [Priestia flexa]